MLRRNEKAGSGYKGRMRSGRAAVAGRSLAWSMALSVAWSMAWSMAQSVASSTGCTRILDLILKVLGNEWRVYTGE